MAGVGNFEAAWIYCVDISLISLVNFPLLEYYFALYTAARLSAGLPTEREALVKKPRPHKHSVSLNNREESATLVKTFFKRSDFAVFSDKNDKP